MTLSEVDIACVIIRRRFYQPIPLPGVGDHHQVFFHVVVSVPETNGNLNQSNSILIAHFIFFPRSRTFLATKPYPKVVETSSRLPFFPTLSQVQQLPKVGLYSLCTCSFIDNVILTDCNRHLLPPNLVAQTSEQPNCSGNP